MHIQTNPGHTANNKEVEDKSMSVEAIVYICPMEILIIT